MEVSWSYFMTTIIIGIIILGGYFMLEEMNEATEYLCKNIGAKTPEDCCWIENGTRGLSVVYSPILCEEIIDLTGKENVIRN